MKYIVYHGTNAKFNKFSTEYLGIGNDALGIGFYFAETTFQAEHYGKNLMKCEITLNKPIILQEGEKEIHQRDVELKMSLKQTIDILKKHPDIYNPDETPLWNIIDISGMDIEDAIEEVAMRYQGKYLSMNMDLFPSNDIEYREALRDVCGYDGILQHTPHGNIYVCWFPEQIKILETTINENNVKTYNDNFYKWFNGSKCVNEKGEPLILYHGTSSNFKSFNKKKLGLKDLNIMSLLGFHFTPDYNMADRLFRKSEKDKVLACYLSIKNPYVCKESDAVKDALKLAYDKGIIDSKKVDIDKLLDMEYFNNDDGALSNLLAIQSHHQLMGWNNLIDMKAIGENYLKYLKSKGYDGVKYLNEIEWAQDKRYDWIAFEPNQIKSIDNIGKWSNSSNIYEELNKELERFL